MVEHPVSFDVLRTWFPDLTKEEKARLNALRDRKMAGVQDRAIPWSHGESRVMQWESARRAFLGQREPFSLIRIGDFETGLLGAFYFPAGNDAPNYTMMFERAGYRAEAFFLRAPFIEAVRKSEFVGLFQNLGSQRKATVALLAMLDCEIPFPSGIEIYSIYRMLVDGTLFEWLSGRRVLLVGGLAPKLENLWKRNDFHKAHERFGSSDKVKIVGSVSVSSREDGGAWKDFYSTLEEVSRRDFDVALVACGAMAKPLTYQIRKLGKTAIDVGFIFDALAGERLDAWRTRDVFREFHPVKPTW